jgi:hypothetical protein
MRGAGKGVEEVERGGRDLANNTLGFASVFFACSSEHLKN